MSVTIDHTTENAAPAQAPVSDRAWALFRALDGKGLVPDGYVEGWKKTFEEDFSPRRGAELVARAWTDPDFRQLLLTDGTAAVAQYGYLGPQGEYIVAVEDTPTLKNVIVCSLCSCTAWAHPRSAADLVQEFRIPCTRGPRATEGSLRDGNRDRVGRRDPRLRHHPPKLGTWSYRNVPQAPKAGARNNCRKSSPRTA
jgi:hypothetical protein